MDNLEHYLDRVCRGIGGPRSLRQHIRQELREHLRDAAAEYRAAGLSEEDALARALEDFGGPEEVGSELAATHGQRLMAVVIDKAMQWKERTMRVRWLWTTWAYLAVVGVIALDLFFLVFSGMMFLPKLKKIQSEGWLELDEAMRLPLMQRLSSFLDGLVELGRYAVLMILMVVIGWGLFEWRVRSENKPFMRLAALGTSAMGLTVVVAIAAGALVLPFLVGFPGVVRLARPVAMEQVGNIDMSVKILQQAAEKKDFAVMQEQVNQASQVLDRLAESVLALARHRGQPAVEELRAKLTSSKDDLAEAQQAIRAKDAAGVEAALQKFRKDYQAVRDVATKPLG
jgi:hypothetical protein